jgi:hypothetical protein
VRASFCPMTLVGVFWFAGFRSWEVLPLDHRLPVLHVDSVIFPSHKKN